MPRRSKPNRIELALGLILIGAVGVAMWAIAALTQIAFSVGA